MASRVAARLRNETDAQVELVKGGLGEFSVDIDERKVISTNRLLYPRPSKVGRKIRELLKQ